MQRKSGEGKRDPKLLRWVWGGCIGLGLGLVGLGFFFFLSSNSATRLSSKIAISESEFEPKQFISQPIGAEPQISRHTSPRLPLLDFPLGSVEEACGFNEFVAYHNDEPDDEIHWPLSLFDASGNLAAFFSESEECRTALDNHVNTLNPYLWGATRANVAFAFFVLDNPLTFERIFADPMGDFNLVQDALNRPECLLQQESGSNSALNESCHADALTNYALINRYCFYGGVRNRPRTYYWEEDNPTPKQDRFMWKQALEDVWVRMKCKQLSPNLKLSKKLHPALNELLLSKGDPKRPQPTVAKLIELAARLGDEAAGLTQGYMPSRSIIYLEHGVMFGRYRGILNSSAWKELKLKKEPNRERFLQTFHFLANLTQTQTQFEWEWLVQHLCAPPFGVSTGRYHSPEEPKESYEHKAPRSCRTVINELYTEELITGSVLEMADKFERTALELDMYD